MGEKIVDIVFKLSSVVSWIIAGLILFKSKIKKTITDKSYESEKKEIEKNKAEQEPAEKELKPMAKFLCDKCGAETAVSDSRHWERDGLICDVCPACFDKLTARAQEVDAARHEVEEAEQRLVAARDKLLALLNDEPVADSAPADEERTESADVLHNLGL